jgi:hypothetical protein
MKRLSILMTVALLGSCASQSRRDEPLLPFHVALIPLQSATAVATTETPSSEEALKLTIDPPALSGLMRKALEDCFAHVTLLSLPDGLSRDEFEQWSTDERNAYWAKASAAAGADLIMESELHIAPQLHGSTNEKLWLNLPLFLAGGPFCYFIGDNTYSGEARLDAWLYDVRSIATSRATLADGRTELAHVQARFHGADLDFLDRAGGNVGSFVASLVIPAGLLARESAHVEPCVAKCAVEDLAQGLARELHGESERLLLGERLTSFYFAPDCALTRQGDMMRFRGTVLLRTGDIQRMDTWRLEVDGAATDGEFGRAVIDESLSTAQSQYLRYVLDVRVPASPSAQQGRLTIVGGGRDVAVRTFTFALAEEPERGAQLARTE